MPEDTPGEEQRTMLTFTEAAERLVEEKIAQSMTAEGLRKLARDPLSGWPIGPGDYRMAGKVRMLPYELLAPYMRARLEKRPGRGPAKTKKGTQTMSNPRTTTVPTPMHQARVRALAALVGREGGHLEITLNELLAAPDKLIVSSTEDGGMVLRDPAAPERDGQGAEGAEAEAIKRELPAFDRVYGQQQGRVYGQQQYRRRFSAAQLHEITRAHFGDSEFSFADLTEQLGVPSGTVVSYGNRLVESGKFRPVGKRKVPGSQMRDHFVAAPE